MATNLGPIHWDESDDINGHRTYSVTHKVMVTAGQGPQTAKAASGIPQIGDTWTFGSDSDSYAICSPEKRVKILPPQKDEKPVIYTVKSFFTTKPFLRCQDDAIEHPLQEPDIVSGDFLQTRVQAKTDKDGEEILSSSHEPYTGSAVEFDGNNPIVFIRQNVAALELSLFSQMINTVNSATLWGLPARTIKLQGVPWQQKIWGVCGYYYQRTLQFEIDYNGWDRTIRDEGDKVLNGHWRVEGEGTGTFEDGWILDDILGVAPDPDNPQHFIQFVDFRGNPIHAILDGFGKPATTIVAGTADGSPGEIDIQYYGESNFFLLGIPAIIGL